MKINGQIRKYFASIGSRGGSTTSQAKKLAARKNGKRGGRPKKHTAKPK